MLLKGFWGIINYNSKGVNHFIPYVHCLDSGLCVHSCVIRVLDTSPIKPQLYFHQPYTYLNTPRTLAS